MITERQARHIKHLAHEMAQSFALVAAAHANYFQQIDPLDDPCDLYIEQVGEPLD